MGDLLSKNLPENTGIKKSEYLYIYSISFSLTQIAKYAHPNYLNICNSCLVLIGHKSTNSKLINLRLRINDVSTFTGHFAKIIQILMLKNVWQYIMFDYVIPRNLQLLKVLRFIMISYFIDLSILANLSMKQIPQKLEFYQKSNV